MKRKKRKSDQAITTALRHIHNGLDAFGIAFSELVKEGNLEHAIQVATTREKIRAIITPSQ